MKKGLARGAALLGFLSLILFGRSSFAAALDREALAGMIVPPYALGEPVNDKGV